MSRAWWQLILILAALGLIVYGFSTFQAAERDDSLRLWVFDVGQGDAILIDTPTAQQILVDGGPDASVLQGLSKALPLTDKQLDLVISTHNDADHLAGLNEVLRHYKVDKIWLTGAVHNTKTYETFLQLIAEKQIPTEKITAGATVKVGALEGIAIFPFDSYDGLTPSEQNHSGIVTYWQYGQETFLLTADIDAENEQAMLSRGVLRHVEILKVAHHGSKTSSSEVFLKAVSPKIAVVSNGRDNRYGHPHAEILQRFEALLIPILRTDQLGTIRFDLWPDRYVYKTGL